VPWQWPARLRLPDATARCGPRRVEEDHRHRDGHAEADTEIQLEMLGLQGGAEHRDDGHVCRPNHRQHPPNPSAPDTPARAKPLQSKLAGASVRLADGHAQAISRSAVCRSDPRMKPGRCACCSREVEALDGITGVPATLRTLRHGRVVCTRDRWGTPMVVAPRAQRTRVDQTGQRVSRLHARPRLEAKASRRPHVAAEPADPIARRTGPEATDIDSAPREKGPGRPPRRTHNGRRRRPRPDRCPGPTFLDRESPTFFDSDGPCR
jgi:hypothetical protein